MRTFSLALLVPAALLLAGCTSKQENLVGAWDCSTIHPGGVVSSDVFEFGQNGQLQVRSSDMLMHGSYTLDGDTLTMRLLDVPVPTDSPNVVTQAQTLTATLGKLSRKQLQMSVSTGTALHKSTCRKP